MTSVTGISGTSRDRKIAPAETAALEFSFFRCITEMTDRAICGTPLSFRHNRGGRNVGSNICCKCDAVRAFLFCKFGILKSGSQPTLNIDAHSYGLTFMTVHIR